MDRNRKDKNKSKFDFTELLFNLGAATIAVAFFVMVFA